MVFVILIVLRYAEEDLEMRGRTPNHVKMLHASLPPRHAVCFVNSRVFKDANSR